MESISRELNLPSEYDSAVENIYKFLNLGWLMISLYVAISLVYFSGAEYRDVIFYALGAPLAYLSTSWIKSKPFDQIRLIPVVIYIYWLPFATSEFVTSPWYSIGLIATCASISSAIFRNRIVSIGFIALCVIAQYFSATQNLDGVSDSKDTLLLNGYFSSLWVCITGIAMLFIIDNYFKYCLELDESLEEVQFEYSKRSQSISRLNLKDYLNVKLHGTILNTLIVAQKMSAQTTYAAITQQLKSDLIELDPDENQDPSAMGMVQAIRKKIDFGRLLVEINQSPKLVVSTESYDFITELIREVVLNINKHTDSEKIKINLASSKNNVLVITISEEMRSIVGMRALAEKAENALQSKSLQRLCKEMGTEYSVNSYSTGSLLHIITVHPFEKDLSILKETKEIRSKSLTSFVNKISAISIIFTVVSIPGFFLEKVPAPMILIILACSLIHFYLLRQKKQDIFLVSLLVVMPLALIPYAYTTPDVCTNLEVLPWLINSLLGAFLYGSYSSSNRFLRWVPGIIIFLECLSANYFLPSACTTLLNGTTPGIAIALILARSLMSRRSRNTKLDLELESLLRTQSNSNLEIQERVSVARSKVLAKVKNFTDSSYVGGNSSSELNRLISLIRAYLLCSEKFERQFFRDLFDWIYERSEIGLTTALEVYDLSEEDRSSDLHFGSNFQAFNELAKGKNLWLTLTISDQTIVELKSDSEISDQDINRLNQDGAKIIFSHL